MALLFMDSFDHYASADLPEKWTTVYQAALSTFIDATGGRRSSGALKGTTVGAGNSDSPMVVKLLAPADATCVVGFACKPSNLTADYPLWTVGDGTGWHLGLYATNTTGNFNVRLGHSYTGTVLGTLSVALPIGAYTFIEIKVTIHDTTGTLQIKFDGVSVLTLTNIDTKFQTTAGWTRVGWHAYTGAGTLIDDLYILDGSGAAPWNTFLGDCRVDARIPTGAGATTGWTPSAGANYAAVDEAAPNDDTDYASATASGLTDTFVVQDAPVAGAVIYGVQVNVSTKKSDVSACAVAPVVRHSGTDQIGAAFNPGLSYAYGSQLYPTNPGTGVAWTEADFNAAEFGYKRTT